MNALHHHHAAAAGGLTLNEDALQRKRIRQRNVYISRLPQDFQPADLQRLCAPFGRIETTRLCMEKNITPIDGPRASPAETIACKGYGFVLYEEVESARRCIDALNGVFCCGRQLQVRLADFTATPVCRRFSANSVPTTAAVAIPFEDVPRETCTPHSIPGGYLIGSPPQGMPADAVGAAVSSRSSESDNSPVSASMNVPASSTDAACFNTVLMPLTSQQTVSVLMPPFPPSNSCCSLLPLQQPVMLATTVPLINNGRTPYVNTNKDESRSNTFFLVQTSSLNVPNVTLMATTPLKLQ